MSMSEDDMFEMSMSESGEEYYGTDTYNVAVDDATAKSEGATLADRFFGGLPNTLDMNLVEKGVISAILFQPEDINIAANVLSAEDFTHPKNITIFTKMMEFYQGGKPMDALLLAESLDREGQLHKAGGVDYFMELADTSALWATGNTLEYSLAIKENARLRKMQNLARDIQEKTFRGSGANADDIMEYAYAQLQKLAEQHNTEDDQTLYALAGRTIEMVEEKSKRDPSLAFTGTPTGFVDLDKLTNGFHPGQMIIVAGRPAMGKSTAALNMACSAALYADKTVMFYSLEMTRDELMMKVMSSVGNVPHEVLKTGRGLTMDHLTTLRKTREEMAEKKLLIRDTPELSLSQLRSQCIMQKAKPEGLDMVVVDYIGLMNTSGLGAASRQEEIATLSRSLKLLAKELEIPIIVLAQLNRGSEKATDKTPMVSNLRESGGLEQDADIILLVHRPEVYEPNDRPGIAELIVGKNRGGEQGKVELLSLLEYSKFGNSAGKYISTYEDPNEDEYPGDPSASAVPEDPYTSVPPRAVEEPTGYPEDPFGTADTGSAGPAW